MGRGCLFFILEDFVILGVVVLVIFEEVVVVFVLLVVGVVGISVLLFFRSFALCRGY